MAAKSIGATELIDVDITLEHDWAEATKYILSVKMSENVPNGWRMALRFSKPIKKIDTWRAERLWVNKNRTLYAIKHKYFNEEMVKDELLTFALVVFKDKKGEKRADLEALFQSGNEVPKFPTPAANPLCPSN